MLINIRVLIMATWPCVCLCTSGVGVKGGDAVVLGIDSKAVRADFSESKSVCKMGVSRNVAWIESGFLTVPDENFSTDAEVRHFMTMPGAFADRLRVFESFIKPRLEHFIARARLAVPESWDGQMILQLIFAVNDRGVLRLVNRDFFCPKGSGGLIKTTGAEYPRPGHPDGWVAIGQYEAVAAETNSHPDVFWGGLEQGIERLIGAEIKARPIDVGPPIAVVRVDRTGVHWVQSGVCEANNQAQPKRTP